MVSSEKNGLARRNAHQAQYLAVVEVTDLRSATVVAAGELAISPAASPRSTGAKLEPLPERTPAAEGGGSATSVKMPLAAVKL